jgi:putative aldouronate transport system substrate-binding protein
MKQRSVLCVILTAALLLTCTGCGGEESTTSTQSSQSTASTQNSADSTETTEEFSYPMDGSVTLSWWIAANTDQAGEQQERKNNPSIKWLSEATGVNFDFTHPPIGEEKNAFNILCASNDMPDIISYNVDSYSGGMQKAVDDGVALRLNDYLDQYCPNLMNNYLSDETLAKKCQTTNGDYAYFPCFSLNDFGNCWFGWQIRSDWLEEQNLEAPVTMEDWYNCLTIMKQAYNLEAGIVMANSQWQIGGSGELATAYQTALDYDINNDGEIVFGPVQPQFKDFLAEMNKWYNEGLLHPDFATMDNTTQKAVYNSGRAAACLDSVGAMNGAVAAGVLVDPDFATMGTMYPVLEEGQTPYRGYKNISGVSPNTFISGDIDEDKIETACRFLDYGYSEEGMVLMNFGIEGETYTIEDGHYYYTDLIMNNPDGINKNTAIRLYTFAAGGPLEQMEDYGRENADMPYQQEAVEKWSQTDMDKHAYPTWIQGTQDQQERLSILNTDINTYVNEMVIKFIMGTESLDNFDAYVQHINDLGLEEALEIKRDIYQKAQ